MIYTKWWFWLDVVVIVILLVIQAISVRANGKNNVTIAEAIVGLDYQSESNAPWTILAPSIRKPQALNCYVVSQLFGRDPGDDCEIVSTEEWFDHAIATQPQTAGYEALRDASFTELTEPKVFRFPGPVGNYNMIIVVIGFTATGVYGCYTYAVET